MLYRLHYWTGSNTLLNSTAVASKLQQAGTLHAASCAEVLSEAVLAPQLQVHLTEAADQAPHDLNNACSNGLWVNKQDEGAASGRVHLMPMTSAIGKLTDCKESLAR